LCVDDCWLFVWLVKASGCFKKEAGAAIVIEEILWQESVVRPLRTNFLREHYFVLVV
jgi:hypothetical protein